MRLITAMAVASSLIMACALAQAAPDSQNAEFLAAKAWLISTPPPWKPLAYEPKPDEPLHIPGSKVTYTLSQWSLANLPDWFPQEHPPMPEIVARGHKPAWPCAACHRPGGEGEPSSASLAGLPKAYILEQLETFRTGTRNWSPWEPDMEMNVEARNTSDADLQQAATYFSSLEFTPRTRVVETTMVPKTRWYHYIQVPDADGAREPIGERIIETPEDIWLFRIMDAHSRFIAYVPPGSIARGKALAAKGNGTVPACESYHGAGLHGVGNIPRLAGISPTYIVRQLILFRLGGRTNPEAAPMRAVASQLSLNDMINAAAYATSIKH